MPIDAGSELIALQEALAGRYSLQREVGRGGMGIVYLAHEVALDRPVALKLLPPHLAADPTLRERFMLEAPTAARLSQPSIVPIHTGASAFCQNRNDTLAIEREWVFTTISSGIHGTMK